MGAPIVLFGFNWRGAREQQDFVGDLRCSGPDFLARHDVMIAVARSLGFEHGGIEAGVGLSDAETGFVFAFDHRWQKSPLLLSAAVHHD